MNQLALKDIRVMGKTYPLLILLATILITAAMLSDNLIETSIKIKMMFILCIAMIVYIPSFFATGKEWKYKSDRLLTSLPIKRADIVTVKYVSIFIQIITATLFIFAYTNIAKFIFRDTLIATPMSLDDIIFTISLLLIIFSVSLVMTFINIEKGQYFNQIFYIILILFPTVISKLIDKTSLGSKIINIATLNLTTIFSIILIISLVVYIVSMQISKKVYKAKEF